MNSDKKKYGSQSIGERIKDEMIGYNVDQSTLAKELSELAGEKIDRSLVSKWITGDRAITKISHLKALCEYFGVSADYLLFGIGHAASIDPDITAAMKYTGLSEGSLLLIADIAKESYPHIDWNGNSCTKTEYDNAPLLNEFIWHGMEKILSELQDYSNIILEAEKYIQNANNFLSSPYSDSTAAMSMTFEGKNLLKRLRFQSLSLGETSRTAGDTVFRAEKIVSDLNSVIDELKRYSDTIIEGSET